MSRITFLGTGDFLASERYWNGFVIDGLVLVETPPTASPHLRRSGFAAAELQVVVISHFHADHTFGWPFLLLDLLLSRRQEPLFVVGPPGAEKYLGQMMELGGIGGVQAAAETQLDIRYVEADGSWQSVGASRIRAVQVDHVPHLRSFGYLFDLGQKVLGYSGDTRPCEGLDTLATSSGVLVLECNGPHAPPQSHMHVNDVVVLRERFPNLRLILTHLGTGINPRHIGNSTVPADFDTISI